MGAWPSRAYCCEQRGRDGRGVDEGVVEELWEGDAEILPWASPNRIAVPPAVLEDLFDVLGGGEAERLVGLGHEVADVDAGGLGGGDGLRDAADQQVGDQRRVERAGAEGDEIGVGDGVESAGEGFAAGRLQHKLQDAVRAGGDAGLARGPLRRSPCARRK